MATQRRMTARRRITRAGFGLLATGALLLGSVVLGDMNAGAVAGGGNNGTVKIDGTPINGNDHGNGNNPHVGCVFHIDWTGFDPGPPAPTATVSFDEQQPTGSANVLTDTTIDFSVQPPNFPPGAYARDYDLSAALLALNPPVHKQGYHISVSINTKAANGSDLKVKTFWVQACAPPTASLTLDKQFSGGGQPAPAADPTFDFTVTCTNGTVTQPTPSIKESDPPLEVANPVTPGPNSTCTVTETGNSNNVAPVSTSWEFQNNIVATGTNSVTVTLDQGGLFELVAINQYDPRVVQHADITLDKALSGVNGPGVAVADPTFNFTVLCTDQNPVFLDPAPAIKASDAAKVIATVQVGTTCTITEPQPANGAASVSWTSSNGATSSTNSINITPTSTTTVDVTATNDYPGAAITVTKVVGGTAAPAGNPGFQVDTTCPPNTATVHTPLSIHDGETQTAAEDVINGTTCDITESTTHGATSVTFKVNGVTVASPGNTITTPAASGTTPIEVEIDNQFDPGQGPVNPPVNPTTPSTTTSTTSTTTTLPPTTTTVPPTTTTAPTTTTTEQPAVVLPSSTVNTTTTTEPAQVLGEELARTGSEQQRKLLAAIALMFIGIVMLATGKRLELAYAAGSARTPVTRSTAQHAASMSARSRAWLSMTVAGAALFSWVRRR